MVSLRHMNKKFSSLLTNLLTKMVFWPLGCVVIVALLILSSCQSATVSDGSLLGIPASEIPTPVDKGTTQVRAPRQSATATQSATQSAIQAAPQSAAAAQDVVSDSQGNRDVGNTNGTASAVSDTTDNANAENAESSETDAQPIKQLSEIESLELEIELTKALIEKTQSTNDRLAYQLRLSYLEDRLADKRASISQ